MRWLRSRRWRIFLVAWLLFSVHFATNVVREHYPAFSLVDHGTFRVDEYQGFHSDIFVHRDGHSVVGNQVFVSALAAIPLFIFDPVLDAIENYSRNKLAREGAPATDYRTEKPNRRAFFKLVKERGLDLRFGAATVVTSVFFMAPLTALFLVVFYGVLVRRGVDEKNATVLTFLLGFATPLFFRTSTLNHNMFVMYAMFGSFVLLWPALRPGGVVSWRTRLAAGVLAGITLATDYVGVITIPLLFLYFVAERRRRSSLRTALTESIPIAIGCLPPIAFLLYTQWAMYGDALKPGQYWMPDQNIYVGQGVRGFTAPDPGLFLRNLFDPAYGLYTWAPLLLLALWPAWRYPAGSLVLPRFERRWVVGVWIALVVFASMNQYSRLQFNSGFRYLLPLVPLLVLALADHWVRLNRAAKTTIAAVAILHSWVLTVFREPVHVAWRLFVDEGVQLPWYRVLGMTASPDSPWVGTWWVPAAALSGAAVCAAAVWRYGAKAEMTYVQ